MYTRWPAAIILFLSSMVAMAVAAQSKTSPQTRPAAKPTEGTHRFGLTDPLPRRPGTVRIATYNTLNLFDAVDDPTLQGEFDDIKNVSQPERCQKLADAIKEIDADIIALQEVESLEALTWFRDTFLKDAGYNHLASKDVGYYRGVECSIMSRFPIVETKVWLNESLDNVKRDGIGWAAKPADTNHLTYQRSPLMVTIKIKDDYQLTIFSEHHKAGGKELMYHREAEALRNVELIEALRKADPKRNIVVMGDFNAAPWDKSVRVYLKAGMIDTLAYRTTGREDAETPLYKTHESDRVLDYILMNSAAFSEYAPGSGFVYGTLYPPSSYDYRKDQPPPGYASDHYPVVVDLVPHEQ